MTSSIPALRPVRMARRATPNNAKDLAPRIAIPDSQSEKVSADIAAALNVLPGCVIKTGTAGDRF